MRQFQVHLRTDRKKKDISINLHPFKAYNQSRPSYEIQFIYIDSLFVKRHLSYNRNINISEKMLSCLDLKQKHQQNQVYFCNFFALKNMTKIIYEMSYNILREKTKHNKKQVKSSIQSQQKAKKCKQAWSIFLVSIPNIKLTKTGLM